MSEDLEEERSRPMTSVDIRTGDLISLQVTVSGTVSTMSRGAIVSKVADQLSECLREMGVDA